MRRLLAFVLFFSPQLASAANPKARLIHGSHVTRAIAKDLYPAIALFGAHVGEALTYKPLDGRGRASKEASARLERLLRCRQTGQHHRVNPRLADALYQIGRHFPGHRVEIFSGYRPRAFCNRSQSRHTSGSAIDFHVEGVDNKTLVAYLKKAFHPAGIGFYPNGVHVHLDLERTDDAYWVDVETPLEAAVAPAPDPSDLLGGPVAVRPAPPEAEPEISDPPIADPAFDADEPELAVTNS